MGSLVRDGKGRAGEGSGKKSLLPLYMFAVDGEMALNARVWGVGKRKANG